eukprot:2532556-Prymnesium_polylepis.1
MPAPLCRRPAARAHVSWGAALTSSRQLASKRSGEEEREELFDGIVRRRAAFGSAASVLRGGKTPIGPSRADVDGHQPAAACLGTILAALLGGASSCGCLHRREHRINLLGDRWRWAKRESTQNTVHMARPGDQVGRQQMVSNLEQSTLVEAHSTVLCEHRTGDTAVDWQHVAEPAPRARRPHCHRARRELKVAPLGDGRSTRAPLHTQKNEQDSAVASWTSEAHDLERIGPAR